MKKNNVIKISFPDGGVYIAHYKKAKRVDDKVYFWLNDGGVLCITEKDGDILNWEYTPPTMTGIEHDVESLEVPTPSVEELDAQWSQEPYNPC